MFLSPDTSRFWHMVAGFMEQVAADLEVEFDVLFDEGRHRLSYLKLVQQVLSRVFNSQLREVPVSAERLMDGFRQR